MRYKVSICVLIWFCSFATYAQNTPIELGQAIGNYFKKGEVEATKRFLPTAEQVLTYVRLEMPPELLERIDSIDFKNSYADSKETYLFNVKEAYLSHDTLFWQTADITCTFEQKSIGMGIGEEREFTMEITQLEVKFRTSDKLVILTFGQVFELNARWYIGDHKIHVSVNSG